MRRALSQHLSTADKDGSVKAVVVCGKRKNFCAGADIKEFDGGSKGKFGVMLNFSHCSSLFFLCKNGCVFVHLVMVIETGSRLNFLIGFLRSYIYNAWIK